MKTPAEIRLQQTQFTTQLIKDSLKNPQSLEWNKILANENGSVICLEFQAKNGYGDNEIDFATFFHLIPSNNIENWKLHCLDEELIDMKMTVTAI